MTVGWTQWQPTVGEALLAPRSAHAHAALLVTSFESDEATVPPDATGGPCAPEGDMLWQKSPDGKQSQYKLCYAPAFRRGQGPTGGSLTCDANSYVMLEGPRFCCRHPRIALNGQKLKAEVEVCGDMLAEFDPAGQKLRYVKGPSSNATPELRDALQMASLGSNVPSPVGMQALDNNVEWKLLLGQKCKGRDGTLIQWPSGRAEMCPTGTTPVHGPGYMSWQCDASYKKKQTFHCCSVKGTMKCVPNLVDQAANMGCFCPGVGGGAWSDEPEEGADAAGEATGPKDGAKEANHAVGLPPISVILLTSFGFPGQPQRPQRRGHEFL